MVLKFMLTPRVTVGAKSQEVVSAMSAGEQMHTACVWDPNDLLAHTTSRDYTFNRFPAHSHWAVMLSIRRWHAAPSECIIGSQGGSGTPQLVPEGLDETNQQRRPNPDKVEVLQLGFSSVLGSGCLGLLFAVWKFKIRPSRWQLRPGLRSIFFF